jgi:hypothetical protein
VAGLKAGQPGQHPDNPFLSGDMLPGQTGHPPYKGVHLSGCPDRKERGCQKEGGENRQQHTKPSNTQSNTKEKIGASRAEQHAPPPDAPILPAPDCDVLIGLDSIAAWLGISRGQCRGLVDDGAVPTFRLPGRSTRCALKSAIGAAMQEYARRPGAAAKTPPRKRSA